MGAAHKVPKLCGPVESRLVLVGKLPQVACWEVLAHGLDVELWQIRRFALSTAKVSSTDRVFLDGSLAAFSRPACRRRVKTDPLSARGF